MSDIKLTVNKIVANINKKDDIVFSYSDEMPEPPLEFFGSFIKKPAVCKGSFRITYRAIVEILEGIKSNKRSGVIDDTTWYYVVKNKSIAIGCVHGQVTFTNDHWCRIFKALGIQDSLYEDLDFYRVGEQLLLFSEE